MSENLVPPSFFEEPEKEDFYSENLQECLNYSRDFKNDQPLEDAIIKNELIIEKTIIELQTCIDALNINIFVKNKLINIRKQLELTKITQKL